MDNLYQTELLGLARAVRSLDVISDPTHSLSVNNPVCGDKVQISVTFHNGVITERHIAADGCALCAAGSGYWYSLSENADAAKLRALKADMEAYLSEDAYNTASTTSPFMPVRDLKNRHKCVLLAFEASAKLADLLSKG